MRGGAVFLVVAAALLLLGMFALAHGQVSLTYSEIVAVLWHGQDASLASSIVYELRLPRVLTAVGAGAALGVAGIVMQTLFRNSLADPWSLGLLAGGQLGAAMIVVGGAVVGASWLSGLTMLSSVGTVLGAIVGTLLIAGFISSLATRVSTVTLLITGLMLGFLAQGLVSVLLHFTNRTQGRIFASWNDADFAGLTWADLPVLMWPISVGLLLVVYLAKPLTALLLGETYAASMGVNVPRLRRLALLAAVLLSAPVTALCGPVMFVGLIAPHIARALSGSAGLLRLVGPCAVTGALLALSGDTIVHLPWDQHWLHLNAILALVGAPIVIGMLVVSKRIKGELT